MPPCVVGFAKGGWGCQLSVRIPDRPRQDALSLAIIAIKRPDIDNITSVRGAGRLTELRLRVRLVTQLPSTGPHSDPSKFYDALRVQFRNADNDGSLNRYIQSSAVANGVDVSWAV